MGTYNIHAGHCPQGQGASGAVGFLKESVEDRLVKNRVISRLIMQNHMVYDCTDESNCSERQNLYNIVEKCNAHSVDKDISLHLNAGGGTGVEVWVTGYWQDATELAAVICQNISEALKIPNRGVKISRNLYVLNHTNAHSLLVECCFVDNQNDYKKWVADVCGDAIASAIDGTKLTQPPDPVIVVPSPADREKIMLLVDDSWGIQTTKRSQQYYGTPMDGEVSYQPSSNRIYLPNVWSGSWKFYTSGYDAGSQLIRAMETDLASRGFYTGKIDGWAGEKFVIADQEFLKSEGYYHGEIDGSMGPAHVAALQNWLNNH